MTAPRSEQDPTTHVIQIQSQRQHGLRHTLLVAGLGGATLLGALAATDRIGITDFLPDLKFKKVELPPAKTDPAEVEATVVAETIAVEQKFQVQCVGRIGLGVGAKGDIGGIFGKYKIDKMKFGDVMDCGESGASEAKVIIHKNKFTQEVTKVVYNSTGLKPTHGRVDKTDFRNCLDLEADADIKKINKKSAEWQAKKADSKNPGCDKGLDMSWNYLSFDEEAQVKLNDTADAAVQIAMTLNPDVAEQTKTLNTQYLGGMKKSLEEKFPNVPVEVNYVPEAAISEQLTDIADELKGSQYDVKPVFKIDGTLEKITVNSVDGSVINITFQKPKIDPISIVDLQERGLPVEIPAEPIQSPTTTIATSSTQPQRGRG